MSLRLRMGLGIAAGAYRVLRARRGTVAGDGVTVRVIVIRIGLALCRHLRAVRHRSLLGALGLVLRLGLRLSISIRRRGALRGRLRVLIVVLGQRARRQKRKRQGGCCNGLQQSHTGLLLMLHPGARLIPVRFRRRATGTPLFSAAQHQPRVPWMAGYPRMRPVKPSILLLSRSDGTANGCPFVEVQLHPPIVLLRAHPLYTPVPFVFKTLQTEVQA
jgi:hypothetical protein